jgi:hypothetical protein
MQKLAVRQRYWARSFVGWQYFSKAQPNSLARSLCHGEGRPSPRVNQQHPLAALPCEAAGDRDRQNRCLVFGAIRQKRHCVSEGRP